MMDCCQKLFQPKIIIIDKIASIPITVIKFQLKLIWKVISIPFNVTNIFLQSLLYFVFRKTAKYLKYFPFGFRLPSSKKYVPIGSLSNEIWFDVLAFIKFHEAPNLFLVNTDLLSICQEYFFSGNVVKKRRIVRNLVMIRSFRDELLIYDFRNLCKTLPVPEIDPPNVFKSFGNIVVRNDCQKPAIKIMIKFRALISDKHRIQCGLLYFQIINIANKREFNWMEQFLLFRLIASNILIQIARIFSKYVIAKFNGCLLIPLKNKKNLCEIEIPNAREIYELLIADIGKHNELRPFQVFHYDKKKILKLACQIAEHFENEYSRKKLNKNMDLTILLPMGNIPEYERKIYNLHGNHLATLRSYNSSEHEKMWIPAYVFFTI